MITTIIFSIDSCTGAPAGRFSREMEMQLRSTSPERFDRSLWVTDPPRMTAPDISSQMNLQVRVLTGKNNEISRSIAPQLALSDFRTLNMIYPIPDEAKQFRRFSLVETFTLPNEFLGEDEYYNTTIHEKAKLRTI